MWIRRCLCPNTSTWAPQLPHTSSDIGLLLRRIMETWKLEEEALPGWENEVFGSPGKKKKVGEGEHSSAPPENEKETVNSEHCHLGEREGSG